MAPTLRLDCVSKTFGAGEAAVPAVQEVSLAVEEGELVLVMGPSGAGKTTLLAMCGTLLRPDTGTVWLGEAELTGLSERQLPEVRLHRVGFIFQSASLLANLTALENVRVVPEAAGARPREADRVARARLDDLRLSHRADALPEALSGGERQRVAIARALANDPPLLLADEPTANLDSRSGYQLMHTLERLVRDRGKTVVAVSHDHRIEDVADRVLWLEDGQLSDRPPDIGRSTRDPVCGMMIDASRAAGEREASGERFWFCSDICVERFDAEPARYVTAEADRW